VFALSRGWWFWGTAAVVGYAALAGLAQYAEVPSRSPEATLRWGGDRTGGGPYIYEEKGELTGFEVELAAYLAGELGLRSEFVQGQWDKLPARLNRGDIDVVLNGYEWSPEREQEWASTIPYYIYTLQLLAHKDNAAIQSWNDLRGKRVGVLRGSAAHRYVEKEFGEAVHVEAYSEGVTSAMDLVQRGQLDATVQDWPAAIYYRDEFPDLRPVGEPVAPGYYVMFVRHDNPELRARLNQALRKAISDGTLKRIYSAYGIWNDQQERLKETAERWPPVAVEAAGAGLPWSERVLRWFERAGESARDYGLLLLRAAGTTVLLSFLSMPLAMLLGLLVAVGRLYGPGWMRWPLAGYVEFLRGTPLLLQLYVIYFLLPDIGLRLPPFWAGVLGLAINYSAYEAENYRAGLLAIPRGQMEAALALGMTKTKALRHIIIPQAVRIVIPPVTNDFIALFKDTSVCSVIAVTELTGRYSELYNDHPSLVLQLGLMTALLYLLMSYPLSLVARRLERRFPKVV
jgi:polar amino acid transport system substrate-binding protein